MRSGEKFSHAALSLYRCTARPRKLRGSVVLRDGECTRHTKIYATTMSGTAEAHLDGTMCGSVVFFI
jgi:hypothetical protein